MTLDLDAIRARYDRAIEAKPSKGDYTADDFAEHYGHLPVMMANTVQILANYLTGEERSWDAEEADLDLSWTIESVQQHGIVNPITLGTDGRVLDGHHRLLAARKLGISQVPVRLAIMPTEPAPSLPPTEPGRVLPSLPIAVKAVTDQVRGIATTQAIACHAAPSEYGPERPWLDLLAMLDQIDAEMGVER